MHPNLITLLIIFLLIFLCLLICWLICLKRLINSNQRNKRLLEGIDCKDVILKEYAVIRHEYNNILQTLVNYVEDENLDGIKEYKNTLLEKSRSINKNNLTQLGKIEDINILCSLIHLNSTVISEGIIVKISVNNVIKGKQIPLESMTTILNECLQNANQAGLKITNTIDLIIKKGDNGFSICFDHEIPPENEKPNLNSVKLNKIKNHTGIAYNIFLRGNHLIQEVMISDI